MANHEETRLTILNTLYPKYYSELSQPLDTDSVLKEAFPNQDEFTRIYPELNYLNDSFLIKSVQSLGRRHPQWIRITEMGIDKVESHNKELQKMHYIQRIKILKYLYQEFFEGKNSNFFSINDIAQSTELDDSHAPEFLMELEYLDQKGLIKALKQSGRIIISHAKITSIGIDTIESIVKQSIEEMSNVDDPEIKSYIKEINQENNHKSKIVKVLGWSDVIKPWLDVIVKIAPMFIGS